MNTSVPPLPTSSNPGPKSGLAVTSLVLGILSLTLCGFFTGLPAIITGHIASVRAWRTPAQFGGVGMATVGFIMGYVSVFFTLLIMPALHVPALLEAKGKIERIKCVRNLRSVSHGARLWAEDHDGQFPSDFLSIKTELGTPRILVCPSDGARKPALDWSSLTHGNISYVIVSPGTTNQDPSTVFVHCPIHNNEAMVDGSVHQWLTPPGK